MAKCKYSNKLCANAKILNGSVYCDSKPCSLKDELPKQTYADRIRSMNDYELAEFIEKIKNTCIVDAFGGEKMCETKAEVECKACKMKMGSILNWLQSEVKGSE